MKPLEQLQEVDSALAAQSRAEGALQLRLGQVLEVLGRGACFELGFSSLTAYALERCERSARWVESARCLARRLEGLPMLRHAVARGEVAWSKAVLVARVATRKNEPDWLQAAQRLTVRELTARIKETTPSFDSEALHANGADDDVTITLSMDREEAWLFEATRALLSQLGIRAAGNQLEALLAEAQNTLLNELPKGTLDLEDALALDSTRARWREQLARWRAEAEAACEAHLRDHQADQEEVVRASTSRSQEAPRGTEHSNGCTPIEQTIRAATLGCATLEGLAPHDLDALVRSLSRALAEHELTLSRRILELYRLSAAAATHSSRTDAWLHLGYASETHYARERLGMSRSSLRARRALAVELEALPRIAEALSASHIGVEAALQIVRIATPETEAAWLKRAQQRTIKHLREEVDAALVAVRMSGQVNCPPPSDTEIDAFHELERAASSGRIFQPSSGPTEVAAPTASAVVGPSQQEQHTDAKAEASDQSAWRTTLDSLAAWLAQGVQMCAGRQEAPAASVQTSAAHSGIGRVVIRLRVSRETLGWWRSLERQARRWLPRGMSWTRFCCLSLWQAWRHLLNPQIAYEHINIRDRHRCTSPVCNRRDITPHHIQFRSAGGTDDDANITAPCTWCHLFGIHGGRIRAVGSAKRIRWEIGRRGHPCVVVEGRERQAA